jgi:hypothetical protein
MHNIYGTTVPSISSHAFTERSSTAIATGCILTKAQAVWIYQLWSAIMDQPPVLTHIKRVRLANRKIEHLLRLLERKHVADRASGAVCLLNLIPDL